MAATNKNKKIAQQKVSEGLKKESVDLTKETSKEPVKGLGDVIKSVTSALGIETCEKCEERRQKLNKAFSFLKTVKRELTDEEIESLLLMEANKRIEDGTSFVKLYNDVFGTRVKPCNCPSIYKELLSKLIMQIEYQNIK